MRAEDACLRVGALTVDLRERAAWVAGRRLVLAPREFDLLADLAARPDAAQSRTVLLTRVWGCTPDGAARASNVVDSAVARLRRALGAGQDVPSLETIRGAGYRLRRPRPGSNRSAGRAPTGHGA